MELSLGPSIHVTHRFEDQIDVVMHDGDARQGNHVQDAKRLPLYFVCFFIASREWLQQIVVWYTVGTRHQMLPSRVMHL